MTPALFAPRSGDDAADGELNTVVRQWPDHGFACHGAPKGLGGPVIHQLVGAIEETTGAEIVVGSSDGCFVEDNSAAKGAIDSDQWHAGDGVYKHLMPRQDAFGVGPSFVVDLNSEDHVGAGEVVSVRCGDHRRLAQRRDAVLLDAAPGDFIESNIETAIRSEVGLEGGVDSSLQELFEVGVVPTVRQFLRPHVLIESIKILGRFLADFLAQNFEQGPSLRRVLDEPIDFGEVRVAAPRSNCPRSKSGLLLAFPDRLLRPQ